MEYVNQYLCQLKASSSTSLYGHIYTSNLSVYIRYGFVATTKTTQIFNIRSALCTVIIAKVYIGNKSWRCRGLFGIRRFYESH